MWSVACIVGHRKNVYVLPSAYYLSIVIVTSTPCAPDAGGTTEMVLPSGLQQATAPMQSGTIGCLPRYLHHQGNHLHCNGAKLAR